MKNIFEIECPKCKQKIKVYVVDKEDEVNGLKIDKVVHERVIIEEGIG